MTELVSGMLRFHAIVVYRRPILAVMKQMVQYTSHVDEVIRV